MTSPVKERSDAELALEVSFSAGVLGQMMVTAGASPDDLELRIGCLNEAARRLSTKDAQP